MKNVKSTTLTFLILSLLSISIYSQNTGKVDYSKEIEKATPKALPQSPVVEKLTSDAEDENLKGKVKTLIEERQGLTGIEAPIGKRMSLIAEFNEKGNFLKQVYFEYRGKPYSVVVYGYIDGVRVSISNSVGEVTRTISVGAKSEENKEKTKADSRYELKYEYKYVNGKLAELQLFGNDGKKSMRYVYNHSGNKLEKLAFTEDGKLNQKYLTVFDEKGNEVEWTSFEIRKSEYGDSKFIIKNDSFDDKGNWTKRTFLRLEVENGKEVYKPQAVEYRKITYYP